MLFINETGLIGSIVVAGTQNITGEATALFYLIIALFFALGIMFSLPLDILFIILFPFVIVISAFSNFGVMLVCVVIYLAYIISMRWFA